MLVIGLTGGIGCGKSTVANLFAQRGITIIDTDHIARELTAPQHSAFNKIIEKFGPSIVKADGSLDRSALRQTVFKDQASRIWLEQLLHPLIRTIAKQQIEACTSTYCIVVIPLLLENIPNPLINRILVVDAPVIEQIKRSQLRDKASQEQIEAIVNTQISREQRLAADDDIINNDKKPADLISQVENMHRMYLRLAKQY